MGAWAEAAQVCIFDMQRGQQEGHELDKILFFSPTDCPLPSQLSVIGLSEGLITFTRIFSPEAPCQLMQAEQHCHIFLNCEPDIWMVMVVEKAKEVEEEVRAAALEAVLKEAHELFVMFYGSIRALLHKHPAGDVARSCLHAFMPDYFADFLTGKKLQLPSIGDGLTERGTMQPVSLERDTVLHAQSLVGLLESCFGGGIVRHTLILFHGYLVSSTLPVGDTAALFSYAALRLTPAAIALSSSLHSAHKGQSTMQSPASRAGQSKLRTLFNNVTPTLAQEEPTIPSTSPLGQDTAHPEEGVKSQFPRPLRQDAWWKDKDGFLATDAWGADNNGVHPTIWLQQSEEQVHLCVYQYRALTLLLLSPTLLNGSNSLDTFTLLKEQLLDEAAQKIEKLEERLSKEWVGSNASHVPGYRYLCCDRSSKTATASPPSKVSTLSKESLSALNQVRAEIDFEKGRVERQASEQDPELEVCLRTKQNAWVIVRVRGGHELYTVQERASDTLVLASDAVEKLNKRHFHGQFSSD
ncbi:hypothetical protein CY35_11G089700 [Sphagnum magellanicum]|nr:hypothetical protein CY35_11G089700 [Sphagnum magellanicum]